MGGIVTRRLTSQLSVVFAVVLSHALPLSRPPQPGNHRFRKLSTPYYRSLACVIVVYDVTRCGIVVIESWADVL